MPTNYRQTKSLNKLKLIIKQHVYAAKSLIIYFFILFIRFYQRIISPLFGLWSDKRWLANGQTCIKMSSFT